MAAGSERRQLLFEMIERGEEIGQENDEPAFFQQLGDVFERQQQIGGWASFLFFQSEHEVAEVAGAIARGQIFADTIVEGEQADGIALGEEEVSERRSESIRVLGFRDGGGAKMHGPALIDEQLAAEVGFVFEFF